MWTYMKMLQYPVNIKTTDAKLAMAIITQLGGPDGEKGASTRYLSQRYAMPDNRVIGVLTDIGTEEPVPHRYQYIITPEYAGAGRSGNCRTARFEGSVLF